MNNKGNGGRGKAIIPYLLSGKLFCGDCLSSMIGFSGTSYNGAKHRYYKEKNKECKNITVRKSDIEDKVIQVVRDMLTEENQMLIARKVSALCEKEQDNPNLKRLQKLMQKNENQKANLLDSLKVGKASAVAANYVFSEIDKLDKEVLDLEHQAAIEKDRHYGLSESDILYFLSHLVKGNIDDFENRKLLINLMINRVYVYTNDDGGHKLTIIFNVTNQPPMKVDVSLLNEIQHKKNSSSTIRYRPPNPDNSNPTPIGEGFGFLSRGTFVESEKPPQVKACKALSCRDYVQNMVNLVNHSTQIYLLQTRLIA